MQICTKGTLASDTLFPWHRYLAIALAAMLAFAAVDKWAAAADRKDLRLQEAVPGRPISLRDRLVTGLQARLKSEIAFVDAVVAAVNKGRLPRRLVDETFFWARDRARLRSRLARRRRPIIYFQPAIVARAARIGVTI